MAGTAVPSSTPGPGCAALRAQTPRAAFRAPVRRSGLLAAVLLLGGCGKAPGLAPAPDAGAPDAPPAATVATAPRADPDGSNAAPVAADPVHDPAHPPIDCPLRRAGIDPTNLQPFDEAEKYIAFLERPDRAAWQKPDDVVAALQLAGTETVVDLGAGSGYFTFRLARALPLGRVIAADTEAEMIRHIHHLAMSEGVQNVQAELIPPDDPRIPPDADLVFVCDVLHHVPDRAAWLGRIAAELKPGARLVLVEFKEGDLPEGPPESVKISRARMLELATTAGFDLETERPDLLPYQTFLVFRRAP
ncbi:MAG: class I SAM-dependent methyltransferase [Deltaproteobacteria bacterium]|nr:class I SAM-dependent methyltransferase [Deltaproteobacteria bacterium]